MISLQKTLNYFGKILNRRYIANAILKQVIKMLIVLMGELVFETKGVYMYRLSEDYVAKIYNEARLIEPNQVKVIKVAVKELKELATLYMSLLKTSKNYAKDLPATYIRLNFLKCTYFTVKKGTITFIAKLRMYYKFARYKTPLINKIISKTILRLDSINSFLANKNIKRREYIFTNNLVYCLNIFYKLVKTVTMPVIIAGLSVNMLIEFFSINLLRQSAI